MKKEIALKNNSTFGILLAFLIVAIIYLHCQPLLDSLVISDSTLSFIYDKITALFVLAMPILLGVSGYFLYGAKSNFDKWKNFIKILKILFWSELLYLIISFAYGGVGKNLLPFFNLENLTNLFTGAMPIPISEGVSNLSLWYFVVLAIVAFVEWFAGKYRGKVMLSLAIIGFLVANLHGVYASFADNTIVIPILDRIFGTEMNFLMQGFLYISIGYFIHKYQSKLIKTPKWVFAIAIPVGVTLFLLERQFLTTNGFMIPILVAIIIIFSVVVSKIFHKKLIILANWGTEYVLYMYIFFPIIIFLLNLTLTPLLLPANLLMIISYWLLACVLSLLVSIGFVKLKNIVLPVIKKARKGLDGKIKKFLA